MTITVYYAGTGHFGLCSACGFKSRIFTVPDTAYVQSKKHKCRKGRK